jgi:hypothetical protein
MNRDQLIEQVRQRIEQGQVEVGDRFKMKQSEMGFTSREQYVYLTVQKILCENPVMTKCLTNIPGMEPIVSAKALCNREKATALFDHIGQNPFDEAISTESSNTSIGGVMSSLFNFDWQTQDLFNDVKSSRTQGVQEVGLDPFVVLRTGDLFHYQRGYVWTIQDKQKLIDSIYRRIEIGRIVVRSRSTDWIEANLWLGREKLAYTEVVDGKQRLTCLLEFLNNGIHDSYGNYFSDLSRQAQREFVNHGLITTTIKSCTDRQVIKLYLRSNEGGVVHNQSDIDRVSEILQKL